MTERLITFLRGQRLNLNARIGLGPGNQLNFSKMSASILGNRFYRGVNQGSCFNELFQQFVYQIPNELLPATYNNIRFPRLK